MTLGEARKLLGQSESKYSDEQLSDMLIRMQKLAEIIYPVAIEKLQFSSEK